MMDFEQIRVVENQERKVASENRIESKRHFYWCLLTLLSAIE